MPPHDTPSGSRTGSPTGSPLGKKGGSTSPHSPSKARGVRFHASVAEEDEAPLPPITTDLWTEGQASVIRVQAGDNYSILHIQSKLTHPASAVLACGGAGTPAQTLAPRPPQALVPDEYGQMRSTGLDGVDSGYRTVFRDLPLPADPRGGHTHTEINEVSGGKNHCIGTTRDGVLVVWGDNSYGQLGLGDDASHIKYEPSPVALISCMKHVITIVSAGAEHSLAVSNAGLAFSWGNAANGRLGQGLNRNRAGHATPTIIDRFKSAGLRVSRVSAGAMHSLAVTDNGHVFSWGWAKHGILGNGCKTDQGTPQEVSSLKSRGVWDVVAGDTHSVAWCSISHGGQLYTWGGNFYGQLGHGHEDALYIPKVVKALAGKGIGVVHVATGKRHTVIATTQGVYTCGYGVQGQLGLGSGRENVCSPTMVGKLRGRHIICVAAGKTHSVAVTHTLYDTPGDVEVWSWGDGDHGQLGHGDLKEYCEPRQIQVVAELSNPPPQYSTKVSHGAITQATINRREADHRMKVLEHCHAANDDKMAESVVHSINRGKTKADNLQGGGSNGVVGHVNTAGEDALNSKMRRRTSEARAADRHGVSPLSSPSSSSPSSPSSPLSRHTNGGSSSSGGGSPKTRLGGVSLNHPGRRSSSTSSKPASSGASSISGSPVNATGTVSSSSSAKTSPTGSPTRAKGKPKPSEMNNAALPPPIETDPDLLLPSPVAHIVQGRTRGGIYKPSIKLSTPGTENTPVRLLGEDGLEGQVDAKYDQFVRHLNLLSDEAVKSISSVNHEMDCLASVIAKEQKDYAATDKADTGITHGCERMRVELDDYKKMQERDHKSAVQELVHMEEEILLIQKQISRTKESINQRAEQSRALRIERSALNIERSVWKKAVPNLASNVKDQLEAQKKEKRIMSDLMEGAKDSNEDVRSAKAKLKDAKAEALRAVSKSETEGRKRADLYDEVVRQRRRINTMVAVCDRNEDTVIHLQREKLRLDRIQSGGDKTLSPGHTERPKTTLPCNSPPAVTPDEARGYVLATKESAQHGANHEAMVQVDECPQLPWLAQAAHYAEYPVGSPTSPNVKQLKWTASACFNPAEVLLQGAPAASRSPEGSHVMVKHWLLEGSGPLQPVAPESSETLTGPYTHFYYGTLGRPFNSKVVQLQYEGGDVVVGIQHLDDPFDWIGVNLRTGVVTGTSIYIGDNPSRMDVPAVGEPFEMRTDGGEADGHPEIFMEMRLLESSKQAAKVKQNQNDAVPASAILEDCKWSKCHKTHLPNNLKIRLFVYKSQGGGPLNEQKAAPVKLLKIADAGGNRLDDQYDAQEEGAHPIKRKGSMFGGVF